MPNGTSDFSVRNLKFKFETLGVNSVIAQGYGGFLHLFLSDRNLKTRIETFVNDLRVREVMS